MGVHDEEALVPIQMVQGKPAARLSPGGLPYLAFTIMVRVEQLHLLEDQSMTVARYRVLGRAQELALIIDKDTAAGPPPSIIPYQGVAGMGDPALAQG